MGFKSSSLLRNIGSYLLIFVFLLIIIPLLILIGYLIRRSPCLKKISDKIKDMIFFSAIIRPVLQSYLTLTLSLMIGIKDKDNISTLEYILSILLLIAEIFVPILIFIGLFLKRT